MPSKPEAFVVHSLKGRLRLKLPALRNNKDKLAKIASSLETIENIKKLTINPQTGSILIEYDGSPQAFWKNIRELDVFNIKKLDEVAVKSHVHSLFKKADEKVKESSHYRLDLATSVGLACMAVGLYQLLRGKSDLPVWHTAFWYAFNFFKK